MKESKFASTTQSEELKKLELAIEKDFGLKLTIIKKAETGVSNEVYEARLKDKVVFIRKCKDARAFEAEVLGYATLQRQGVPVPKVISALEHPSAIGQPTIILSSAEGVAIKDAELSKEEKVLLYTKVGKLLKKFHEIKLEGFGKPEVIDGKLKGESDTYKDYRKEYDAKIHKAVEFLLHKDLLNTAQEEKIRKVCDEIQTLDFGSGSLLHGDLHDKHVFITGDRITGIIDLGSLRVGDPRYDIADCLYTQKDGPTMEAFKQGYGELATDPIVDKYLLLIIARKIVRKFEQKKEVKNEMIERLHQLLAEI